MKKIIIGALLATISTTATADQTMSSGTAKLKLFSTVESFLVLNDVIKPEYRDMSYTAAVTTVNKMLPQLDQGIVKAIDQGASCELIAAAFTTNSFNPTFKGMLKDTSEIRQRNMQKVVSLFTVYTFSRCKELTA